MTIRRKLEWMMMALTVGLMIWLKWLHYGVTHYNIFLIILLAWSLVLIVVFRSLHRLEPDAPVKPELRKEGTNNG